MNHHLQQYRVAVQHPEVSGFEHLDLQLVREALAVEESQLSKAEEEQLAAERQQRAATPERWWYLDVVRTLPQPVTTPASVQSVVP